MDLNITTFDAMIDEKFGVSVGKYYPQEDKINLMREWCDEIIGKHAYKNSFGTFYFMKESHRTLFLLKWS